MQPTLVVAGIIVGQKQIMIAQRRADQRNALKWEFPGGKVEEGETPEAALERELFEELGVRTRTGRIFDARLHAYPGQTVLVLFYFTEITEGTPKPLDANALCWTEIEKLNGFDFSGADALVAECLASEFSDAGTDNSAAHLRV